MNMTIEEMKDHLETLLASSPETGEQWAAICLLEQQIVDAEQDAAERAYEHRCEAFYGGSFKSLQQQQIEAQRLK
jgi:hypothetical protein